MFFAGSNRVRAWWGEVLLAESTRTIQVERPDGTGELWFPLDAINPGRLVARSTFESPMDVWDIADDIIDAAPPPMVTTSWAHSRSRPDAELAAIELGDRPGTGILRSVRGDSAPDDLAGHGCFDHHRVRIEVDDSLSDDPRDTSVKRYPVWGDTAHLVSVLDVQPAGDCRFRGIPRITSGRPVVEGSQMLAQAIVAACKHVPNRRVVSAHMVFCRPADANQALDFEIDEHAMHRTMATLGVRVMQDGKLRAVGELLLDAGAPDAIRHEVSPPRNARPYNAAPCDMGVLGRDVRIVDGAFTRDPDAPVGPPTIDAWVRFGQVPDEQYLHAALLVHFTGHMSIAAALRPHAGVGLADAHRTLSTAINAIGVSLHAPVRADHWMMYRHHSTFAGDGMTHAECRVHAELGDLLASFSVDAMVRPFLDPEGRIDERRVL